MLTVQRSARARLDFGSSHDPIQVDWSGSNYVILQQDQAEIQVPLGDIVLFCEVLKTLAGERNDG